MPDKMPDAGNLSPCEQFAEVGKKTIKRDLELCEKTVTLLRQVQAKKQLTPKKWNELADELGKHLAKHTSQIVELLAKLPQDESRETRKRWEASEGLEEDLRDGIVASEVKAEVPLLRELIQGLLPCPAGAPTLLLERNAEFVDMLVEGGTKGDAILRGIGMPLAAQIARIRSCMITAALAGTNGSLNVRPVEASCALAKRSEQDDGQETFAKLREGSVTPLGLAKRKHELLYAVAILKEAEEKLKEEDAKKEEQRKWQGSSEDVLGQEPDTEEAAGLSKVEILRILEADESEEEDEFGLNELFDFGATDGDDGIQNDIESEKQRWMDRIPPEERGRWEGLVAIYAELRARRDRVFPILDKLCDL
jgi:hypothetical protein